MVFDAKGHGITEEEFAPKLIGQTTSGNMIYGYARLPYIDYKEPILSACAPVFKKSDKTTTCNIEIQNFGLVSSKKTKVKIEYLEENKRITIASGEVQPLKPYEKTEILLPLKKNLIEGKEYNFIVTISSHEKELSTFNLSKIALGVN